MAENKGLVTHSLFVIRCGWQKNSSVTHSLKLAMRIGRKKEQCHSPPVGHEDVMRLYGIKQGQCHSHTVGYWMRCDESAW